MRGAFLNRLTQASSAEVPDQNRALAMADALVGILLNIALHARSGAEAPRLRELYKSGLSIVLRQ